MSHSSSAAEACGLGERCERVSERETVTHNITSCSENWENFNLFFFFLLPFFEANRESFSVLLDAASGKSSLRKIYTNLWISKHS